MVQLELPVYEVKPSEDFPGWLVVRCPREDCNDIFIVRKSLWLKTVTRETHNGKSFKITGRSCPYCHRSARIPRGRRVR